ncbi:MAG: response regulator transcription factor [Polyangiaceae bacterium]|nr:response regulator transcription factor [Polyangiaceae bacterium]
MRDASEPASSAILDLGLHVVVIDDDDTTRLLVRRWLERGGMNVWDAPGGAAGLELVRDRARSVGVVVLDVMMPDVAGFEVLQRLRAGSATSDIPVIMLSAHANREEDVVEGIQLGASAQLEKPFRGPVLQARVKALLEQRGRQLSVKERL